MSAMNSIRVVTVDDHPFLRAGIVAVIEEEDDMTVVAEAADGHEALLAYRKHLPDLVLMDIQLPRVSGVDVIVALRGEFPEARIIVLTTFEGDALARKALRAGASGYLLKSLIRKELIDAIRSVHQGNRYITTKVATELAEHLHSGDLSPRELEVLKAVATGQSNGRIASQLVISEETVKGHMKNILLKLDASDRTHAVSIATIRGLFI